MYNVISFYRIWSLIRRLIIVIIKFTGEFNNLCLNEHISNLIDYIKLILETSYFFYKISFTYFVFNKYNRNIIPKPQRFIVKIQN